MEKLKFSFMKKLHIGLLPRILIAIAFGILFGNFLPGELPSADSVVLIFNIFLPP